MAGYIGSKVAVVSSGAERKKVFTATSGQTSFTGLSYTVNNVHVFQNGVRLVDGTDYTATNGNSIILTVGAATNDQVVVVSYNTFQTSDTVSASTGGTFAGDVNFTGAFTSQGIDDNATSTAMTLDSSGNVLLSKTSSATNTVGVELGATGYGAFCRDANKVAIFNRKTNDGTILDIQKDGSTVGSIGAVFGGLMVNGTVSVNLDNGTNQVGFGTGAIAGNGIGNDAVLDLGRSNRRFKDLYLSGGVYLGGTGSANLLDDYEAGTFIAGFSGATVSAGNYTGFYTKIGQVVHWNYYSQASNISGASGTAKLTGLPFTVLNNQDAYEPVVTSHNTFFGGSATAGVSGYHSINNTTVVFVTTGGTGASTFVNGGSQYIMVSGTYVTAS